LEVLRTENICKQFGNHVALSDVSIHVPARSIYGLLGPNGAGKTTLIRIITQIIAADKGQTFINGAPMKFDDIRKIGYLPEERGLYKKMKVGEQLLYLAQLKDLDKKTATERIRIWLRKFEIDTWWDKKVEDLSKGMQQKIQFIATVLHQPDIIILDEPFSGFDPINVNLLKDEILRLREEGSTIIFSTHRMESVEELCDHIALINESEKIIEGPKDEIKQKFKTNTFNVKYRGNLESLDGAFQVLETGKLDGEHYHSRIRIMNGMSTNDLLMKLTGKVEVVEFTEDIPSMNDIFISIVKGGHDV
jgi:ABC-2 type transport system ATP-binding protein